MKRSILAVLAVFVIWTVLDFVIHGLVLQASYERTAALWRPMTEMKLGLMRVVTLLVSAAFVAIYARLITPKSVRAGLGFGVLYGVANGLSFGYGSYAVMPIPYHMALTWFLGTVVQGGAAGLLVGLIVRPVTPTAVNTPG